MLELKSAFLLGFCNIIVGCNTKYFIGKLNQSIDAIGSMSILNIGFMIGSLISEYFCMRFSYRSTLTLVWLSFLVSSLMLLPVVLNDDSVYSFILACAGISLNYITQPVMIICEVRILKDTIKSYPNTYSLAVLYSMNQLPWVSFYFISELESWQVYLMLICSILVSILISSRFKNKRSSSILMIKDKHQHTILPFSAFVLESFSYGVLMVMFRIENQILSDEFNSFSQMGYIIGAFLVNFLLNYRNNKVIFSIIVGVPILFAVIYLAFDTLAKFFTSSLLLGFSTFGLGVAEVLNIRLIVLNSNRPEFFIGMLYFISYFTEYILLIMLEYIFPFVYAIISVFALFNFAAGYIFYKELSK